MVDFLSSFIFQENAATDLDEFYLEFQTNSVKKNIIYSTIENSTFISFYSNQNGIIKQSEMTIEKNKISFSGSNEAIIYKGNLIPYEMIIYKLFPQVFNTHYVKVLFIEEKNIGYIPIKTYGKNILCSTFYFFSYLMVKLFICPKYFSKIPFSSKTIVALGKSFIYRRKKYRLYSN